MLESLTEGYRGFGLQPLVRAKNTCCPLPSAAAIALERQFLAYGVLQLVLVHADEVHLGVVVVEQHMVGEHLVACC